MLDPLYLNFLTNRINEKVVFFDRDGVLNKDLEYIDSINRIEIMHQNLERICSILKKKSFDKALKIIVSNQSGVSRSYFSVNKAHEIMQKIINDISNYFSIDAYLFAPYHEIHKNKFSNSKLADYYRKPNPGMIEIILKKYNIHKENALLFGDRQSDKLAALKGGINSENIYILK